MSTDTRAPAAELHPLHAVALIVGIVIGAGIFKAPSVVAELTGDPLWMLALWATGGLVSLLGALCYAELATAWPHVGGDYHFLGRAYGRAVAFLFAWARFTVITTGSIALLAFIFGDYLQRLLPLPGIAPAITAAFYAACVVLLLTALNLRGVRTGAQAQSSFTILEVGGLLLIIAAACMLPAAPVTPLPATAPAPAALGLAMVFVLLSFGGWNEAACISAELRNRQQSMRVVLLSSLAIITALYLAVVWAYWHGLGLQGMARSETVAGALLHRAFGTAGERLMTLIVLASVLTSLNATILVGARSMCATGRDWHALHFLGGWNDRAGTPVNALQAQAAMSLLLIVAGVASGDGFRAMVEFTAPVFWLFFLLSGLSLFVLRWREPFVTRPFKVPLYPLTPLLFCASCIAMLFSSLSHVSRQALGGLPAGWVGITVLGSGALALMWLRRRDAAAPVSVTADAANSVERKR